ncbi:MAG: TAXI family TRAP transporter solute-binding subunit [Candidatus Hydrogenedentota bacterium]|nr:MAG: TAXI family TRAP transporter solute-binding subunit [Candidatus Hydrogenedentota bacterium]
MTLANLDLKEKIRAILPLYNEEVHIIAKKSIKKVSDLKGHKVNIGPKNSGSEGTASILFKAFEILDVNVDQAPAAEAIDKLKQGKIDAMILTAGAPVALLESLPASLKKKIHLVPIKKEEFEKLNLGSFHYGSSTIPAKTYPWQPKAVETLVIPSVLLGDKGLSSTSVQKIINAVFKHLDELKEKHPKWKNFSKEYAQGFYQINKDLFHEGAKKVLE